MPKPLQNAVLYKRQTPPSAKPLSAAPPPAPTAADIDAVIAAFMAKLGATRGKTSGAARLEHVGDTQRRHMAMNAARARWGKRKVAQSGLKAG